jgi:transaldolase
VEKVPELGGFVKLFIDSADPEQVRDAVATGVVDGVTTNPKLLARSARAPAELLPELCALVRGPVSVPVRAHASDSIVEEGLALSRLHERVVVKVPVHFDGLRAISRLRSEGVRTHATLCCSPNQALLAAKCGAYFVSPFVGRSEDLGGSGLELVAQIIEILDNYEFETQVMVARVRNPVHVQESALLGADACTMSWSVLQALAHHPLTDRLDEEQRNAWNQG